MKIIQIDQTVLIVQKVTMKEENKVWKQFVKKTYKRVEIVNTGQHKENEKFKKFK